MVESLISILLLTILIVSIIGTFLIAKTAVSRANHRITAMKYIRDYLEREVRAGYDGGSDGESDYYVSVGSADPASIVIDDRGTADTSDDLLGTIAPNPYPANEYEGTVITYSGIDYKIVGFLVTWIEDVNNQLCAERAVAYVAEHPSI